MPDHVHILLQMDSTASIADLIKQYKGASAHTINQEKWFEEKFEWSVGYWAFSVSQSLASKVRTYILNQEQHHERIKFKEEHRKLLELHNFKEEME